MIQLAFLDIRRGKARIILTDLNVTTFKTLNLKRYKFFNQLSQLIFRAIIIIIVIFLIWEFFTSALYELMLSLKSPGLFLVFRSILLLGEFFTLGLPDGLLRESEWQVSSDI